MSPKIKLLSWAIFLGIFFLISILSQSAKANHNQLRITERSLSIFPLTQSPIEQIITSTEQLTSTKTLTDTAVLTENLQFVLNLPIIFNQPPASPELLLFCSDLSKPINIPDNSEGGVNHVITIDDSRRILDLNIQVDVMHTWVGDIVVSVTHGGSGKSIRLIDRPGFPKNELGCGGDGISTILDDEISLSTENQCYSGGNAIAGIYLPLDPLKNIDDEILGGDWIINVSDRDSGDTGKLKSWCIEALVGPPTNYQPDQPPANLPLKAEIKNITGEKQSLPLDCESRSAVDWANYFGTSINEIDFFNRLPKSDNPDIGFVGDVYGEWGLIPPNDYGVHAKPVAELLRNYGLSAYSRRPLTWEQLKAEIASSRPVIVWVIGSASMNEKPIYYISSDNHRTIVAHYEHTVIVVGYTETTVIILDGDTRLVRTQNQFLSSWSALDNMAITAIP